MSWQTDRQLDLQEIDGCSVDITAMDQTHHLSWVVAEMFETYLLHDASIVSNEKLYKEAHKISDLLIDFYQLIGREAYAMEQREEKS